MTKLSININKIALLRNARGENVPNLVQFALDCERYGGQGITVHPRPDERHIRYQDVYDLKETVSTELNIEGYPSAKFLKMVKEVKPDQCTLVPDAPDALTSDSGWDAVKHADFLQKTIGDLKSCGIRVSLFMDPVERQIEAVARAGADRIEYYTGPYANKYYENRASSIELYQATAPLANELGLGINAGHDLNLDNLKYFNQEVPHLLEVSIGHALVNDCLYFGLENTIQMYLRQLSE